MKLKIRYRWPKTWWWFSKRRATLFKSVSMITIWLKCKYLPSTTTGAPRWVQAQLGYCREALQVRGVVGGFGLILFLGGLWPVNFKCQEKSKDIRYYWYSCTCVLMFWTHYYKLMIWLDAGFFSKWGYHTFRGYEATERLLHCVSSLLWLLFCLWWTNCIQKCSV